VRTLHLIVSQSVDELSDLDAPGLRARRRVRWIASEDGSSRSPSGTSTQELVGPGSLARRVAVDEFTEHRIHRSDDESGEFRSAWSRVSPGPAMPIVVTLPYRWYRDSMTFV
jgi:hypothetical protein